MILKGNMLKLTIPFFWAVQSIWLLSFKSIETFIAAIILLLISFLGIVIKSNTILPSKGSCISRSSLEISSLGIER